MLTILTAPGIAVTPLAQDNPAVGFLDNIDLRRGVAIALRFAQHALHKAPPGSRTPARHSGSYLKNTTGSWVAHMSPPNSVRSAYFRAS